MIQLSETGTYLVNGTELVADNAEAAAAIRVKTGREVDKACLLYTSDAADEQ